MVVSSLLCLCWGEADEFLLSFVAACRRGAPASLSPSAPGAHWGQQKRWQPQEGAFVKAGGKDAEAERAGKFPVEVYVPLERVRWGFMGVKGAVTTRMGLGGGKEENPALARPGARGEDTLRSLPLRFGSPWSRWVLGPPTLWGKGVHSPASWGTGTADVAMGLVFGGG